MVWSGHGFSLDKPRLWEAGASQHIEQEDDRQIQCYDKAKPSPSPLGGLRRTPHFGVYGFQDIVAGHDLHGGDQDHRGRDLIMPLEEV